MKEEDFTCSVCDVQLSTNFVGKGTRRNWDASKFVCHEHTDEVTSCRLIPKE